MSYLHHANCNEWRLIEVFLHTWISITLFVARGYKVYFTINYDITKRVTRTEHKKLFIVKIGSYFIRYLFGTLAQNWWFPSAYFRCLASITFTMVMAIYQFSLTKMKCIGRNASIYCIVNRVSKCVVNYSSPWNEFFKILLEWFLPSLVIFSFD